MTQMLLFDAPANAVDTAIVSVSERFQAESVAAERSAPVKRSNVAGQLEHDGGLHHMGDLARLVLLRYDVVAKRRATMAARRAAR